MNKQQKIIKETSYCKIYSKVSIEDDDYYSCIERIEVKEKQRKEIRFVLYKDTIRGDNRYIPRSLDVIEIQLLELIKKAIQNKVFLNCTLSSRQMKKEKFYYFNCLL